VRAGPERTPKRGSYAAEAIRLRRWDDIGKIAGLNTPPLDHFRSSLVAGMRRATPEPR
jgi:predicted HD phosphohydrolase